MRIECGRHRLKSTCGFSTGNEKRGICAGGLVAIADSELRSGRFKALIDRAKRNSEVMSDDLERLVQQNLVQNLAFL